MKQWTAFTKKELAELSRTGKLQLLLLLFVLFGIMNPAIAKITPWLMDTMSESLAETGLTVTEAEITALTSWAQFYKNVPLMLIIFLLLFSGILVSEYQKGTLINMITKGLPRWIIIVSKAFAMVFLWTLGYWLCYGITYGYNAWFWDNHVASHLAFSAFCLYLLGIWLISLLLLLSVLFQTTSAVLSASGGIFLLVYFAGLFPDAKPYLPGQLLESTELLNGLNTLSDYQSAIWITALFSAFNILGSVIFFNKKGL